MSGTIPDRVSVEVDSPFYSYRCIDFEVSLDGEVQPNCIEYCISEGWIKEIQYYPNGHVRYASARMHGMELKGVVTVKEINVFR